MAGVSVLITGICGQDGSYLAEQLLGTGAPLVGMLRPGEVIPPYVETLRASGACELVTCDLAEPAEFRLLLRRVEPQRIYHLAAVSRPADCERQPALSRTVNVTSVETLLDWVKRDQPEARVLLASSAAVFGAAAEVPQNEQTPAAPVDEYGRQKQEIRELAAAARQEGRFVACAIPFNHESPRRPEHFVVAKVCQAAARIAAGADEVLRLGNLDVRRDWGYAPEYATALAWMLDIERPVELVLATGVAHSVRELAAVAFGQLGLDAEDYVTSSAEFCRDNEAIELRGDVSLAWTELGWEAVTPFDELIRMMVRAAQDKLS